MSSPNCNYFVIFIFTGGSKGRLGQIGFHPFTIEFDQIVNVGKLIWTMPTQNDLHRDSLCNTT